ncbi:RNA polymerase sigma factor [Furfurilactobacillus siliginis]|uniref:RNA polymerase sigma-70 ECF-like HTH domain-containing protein n=1 Tax=Furfurilactobacillus siliginis TaxID=348151 RepID=A0A0R2KXP3_9LACO|nr:sigma-70 family RNA polymerase sigma factor [Furfurilactobacillus siliginis]KRN94242.1 hypothetical protein IV55_GL000593 [Furfurilactobacillus siliginis]GEK29365.1 hypothetical protein LSI01_16760 [Furfurilactobacillus siliginis]
MVWLSRQQEDTLIEIAKGGDEVAFEQLFTQYLPLINKWYRKLNFAQQLVDRDDWQQECRMVLFNTLNRYQGRHAGEFATYFRLNVRNRGFDLKRRQNARKRQSDQDDEALDGQAETIQIPSHHPDGLALVVLKERLDEVQSELSAFEAEVWRELMNGVDLAEMTIRLKCSDRRLRNAINRCRIKFTKTLQPTGND